jgi:16S rRNA C967 or C1407 C5-methylase (RsmB/RsmF family)
MKLPNAFISRVQQELPELAHQLFAAISENTPRVSIRQHGTKKEAEGLPLDTSIPWAERAYWLKERPIFTLDPAYHAGAYYVQESSSMLLDHVISQLPSFKRALDVCAAPGGKSLIIADRLPEDGFLICNELVPKRADILKENVIRWGNSRVSIVSGEAADLAASGCEFDLILVDAPCSGEGLFRRDPDAIGNWHPDLPAQCAQMQSAILTDILPALAPEGHLIYSTCTFGRLENEAIWQLLQANELEPVALDLPSDWGFLDSAEVFNDMPANKAFRAIPGFASGEGFFIAAFKKPASKIQGLQPRENETTSIENPFLRLKGGLELFGLANQQYAALPKQWETVLKLSKKLKVIHAAGEMGMMHPQNGFVPAHALALSTDVETTFETHHFDLTQARWYLARKDFSPAVIPTGYFLISWQGHRLGWAFNKRGKFVNCFPALYKIRMDLPRN